MEPPQFFASSMSSDDSLIMVDLLVTIPDSIKWCHISANWPSSWGWSLSAHAKYSFGMAWLWCHIDMRLRGYDFLRKNCNTFTVPKRNKNVEVGKDTLRTRSYKIVLGCCRNAETMCIESLCSLGFGQSLFVLYQSMSIIHKIYQSFIFKAPS